MAILTSRNHQNFFKPLARNRGRFVGRTGDCRTRPRRSLGAGNIGFRTDLCNILYCFDFVSIFGNLSGLGRTFFGRLVFVDASALVSLVFLRRRRRPGRRRRRQPMLVPRTVPVAPLPLLLLPLVPVRIRRLPVFVFPLARVLGPLLAAFSAVLSPNVGFEQAAEKMPRIKLEKTVKVKNRSIHLKIG